MPFALFPYEITTPNTDPSRIFAEIDYIPNTNSIDALKKNFPGYKNLLHFFKSTFKSP